jgi:hypothetical protein
MRGTASSVCLSSDAAPLLGAGAGTQRPAGSRCKMAARSSARSLRELSRLISMRRMAAIREAQQFDVDGCMRSLWLRAAVRATHAI